MRDASFKRHGEIVTITTRTNGFRNGKGEWQPGNAATITTHASIEPVKADATEQLPAGARLEDTRIFYIDPKIVGISTGGSGSTGTATTITYKGEHYRTATVEAWTAYTKITAVRITP